jgi:plasmid stabilization system protein ParE
LQRAEEFMEWIARADAAAARRWVTKLFDRVNQLRQFPDSGRVVPEARRPDIRELIMDRYRIIYRRDPSRIVVLTVRHARELLNPDDV